MRWLLSGALALAMAVGGPLAGPREAAAAPTTCVVTDLLVNPCRPWLGAAVSRYPDAAATVRAQLEAHERRIGRAVDIVHTYHPPGSLPLSTEEVALILRPGTLAFVNWKPALVWADAAGGNATVDAQIDEAADSIRAVAPHKIFLTVFHEPENNVSTGNCTGNAVGAASGSPADYRAMWRNVRDRFDARGVDNVVWVMDYMNYEPWDCLVDELYPGDDLVDWIMFNGYGGPQAPDYVANVQRFYDLLTATSRAGHDYLSKAWGIGEWNIRNATRELGVAYYGQVRAALAADLFPRLRAYVVYDAVGPDGNENRVAYTPGGVYDQVKLDAYAALANDPRLTGEVLFQPPAVPPAVTAPGAPAVGQP